LRDSRMNLQTFAIAVAEHYLAATTQFNRVAKFRVVEGETKEIFRANEHNCEIVTRMMRGVIKFPADLEEPWVQSLPEPFRGKLVRELALRYGLLGARIADVPAPHRMACLADVLVDAGDTVRAMGPILADGKINEADAQYCASARETIARMQADLASLDSQLSAVAPNGAKPWAMRSIA